MKPPAFRYFEPETVEEVVALLDEHGDEAKVLAGGQSLMPMLAMRLSRPACLVDVNRVDDLAFVDIDASGFAIGATVRHADVEHAEELRAGCPLLAAAIPWIGHTAVRNRGTIGGSLAHADPAAELPAVMTALDATIVAQSARGRREIPIGELFVMPLVSTLAADEVLAEIRIPAQSRRAGSAVREVARRHGDFALAGVIATVTLDEGAQIADARLVSFATGPVPLRLVAAETALAGADPGAEAYAEAARLAVADLSPNDDLHASAEYRRHVTGVLVEQALEAAAGEARRRSGMNGSGGS